MLWIGVGFAALLVWLAYGLVILNRAPAYWVFLLLGVVALFTTFCLRVGWRFFFNRPNQFGSILSPLGWRILAGCFAVLTIVSLFELVVVLRDGASRDVLVVFVTSGVGSAVFCYFSLLRAQQTLANARRTHSAL
jgi:hypothetical protein